MVPGTSACAASGFCASPMLEALAEVDLPESLHSDLADTFSKIGAMHLQQVCSTNGDVADFEDQECEFCKVCFISIQVRYSGLWTGDYLFYLKDKKTNHLKQKQKTNKIKPGSTQRGHALWELTSRQLVQFVAVRGCRLRTLHAS